MTGLMTRHLPLVADAPDGIKKLRALILEFAVQGRLIPMSLGLEFLKLADLGKWAVGSGFPTAEQGKKDLPILFCKVSDMNLLGNEKFIRFTNHTIDEDTAKRLRVNIHPAGTVVFPKIGGAISTNKRRILITPSAIDNNCLGITPREGISTDYLYLLLTSIDFTVYQAGTSVPALSQGVIGQISVGLPTLDEQHRIVAKVDELMALCDRLETDQADAQAAHAQLVQALLGSLTQATDAADFRASWQRLYEHFHTLFTTEASIDALKHTVLQLAVMGKLVPHEVASPEVAGALPPGWCEQLINDFCSVQGGIQKTPLRRPVSLHFPYLRVANVQRGHINVTELERYELTCDELAKWRLNKGDLLIVEGNGSENEIGRCAIWQGQVNDCVYQNHLMRVRPNVDEQVHYLAMYLNSPVGIGHMKRLAITTSGLFNLSVGKIRSIPVPLPPLAEQHRIVAKVEELMALCDQFKAQLLDARQLHAQLASVLVEQAVAA
jgi:type I restriction enzyme, S subunit